MAERLFERQLNSISSQAWKVNQVSQSADISSTIETCLLAENVVQMLIDNPCPGQVLDEVYVDWRRPCNDVGITGVSVDARRKGVRQLIETWGIGCISFETHPEWHINNAANLRWLIISGSHEMDGLWETAYIFNGFNIYKNERLLEQTGWRTIEPGSSLDQADICLINEILLGIRDKVGSVLRR